MNGQALQTLLERVAAGTIEVGGAVDVICSESMSGPRGKLLLDASTAALERQLRRMGYVIAVVRGNISDKKVKDVLLDCGGGQTVVTRNGNAWADRRDRQHYGYDLVSVVSVVDDLTLARRVDRLFREGKLGGPIGRVERI